MSVKSYLEGKIKNQLNEEIFDVSKGHGFEDIKKYNPKLYNKIKLITNNFEQLSVNIQNGFNSDDIKSEFKDIEQEIVSFKKDFIN